MSDEFLCFYEEYWNCQMPIQGSDNSAFIYMGLEFGPFCDGDLFRDAKLPDGWCEKSDSKEHWFIILDDKSRARARVFKFKNQSFMYPECRYSISREVKDEYVIFYVWDNNYGLDKSKVIFEKQMPLPDKKEHEKSYKQKLENYTNNKYCEEWLNKNFPKWNDYCAYWDD